MVRHPLLLELHGLAATQELALGAALGNDHLAVTHSAQIAFADDVCHFRIPAIDSFGCCPQRQCYAYFSLGSTKVGRQRAVRIASLRPDPGPQGPTTTGWVPMALSWGSRWRP